ncbi:MAG: hypothetical protein PHH20_01210 [Candidatus Omnitrophica bacterium]|nr:hypothetical protein [Candidatus Omnitrophota bacterium]
MKGCNFFLLAAFAMMPFGVHDRVINDVPQPRIIAPYDTVDITGKNSIEFRWYSYMRATTANGGYFDVRIFKGTNMYESNMIFKQQVGPRKNSIEVDAKLFDPGQVYSWQIRQVRYDLRKSDWVFESFNVTKGSK